MIPDFAECRFRCISGLGLRHITVTVDGIGLVGNLRPGLQGRLQEQEHGKESQQIFFPLLHALSLPYLMPEWAMVFMTFFWQMMNITRLGTNIINVAAAAIPCPATVLLALARVFI